MKAILALADGEIFIGEHFGAEGTIVGEVVFNTAMTGYQEILTDPSYHGQLVTMTYPEIGNTGINDEDIESRKPFVRGFIVSDYVDEPSNWRATRSLGNYMKEHGIIGIDGIDTRRLTRLLRDRGSQIGAISSIESDPTKLVEAAAAAPGLVGRDLVADVAAENGYDWTEGDWDIAAGYSSGSSAKYKVVALDCGIKYNILRCLVAAGCDVTVMTPTSSVADILAAKPDGIFISNGPGDPEGVPYVAKTVSELIGKKPIFGICLGHQILGLALGGKTYKLKFGHHGANQPVSDLATGKVEITSQNHNFAVDVESLGQKVVITHMNLNDKTCEGIRVADAPVFSVQYHPEASPGPHDSNYLFHRFVEMIENNK